MKLQANKGMYLEQIINNSIDYYKQNNIALIEKLPIPVKIFENNHNIVKAKLYLKSKVDYYGIYQGRFVCIEAKQTNQKVFYLANIAAHQYQYMQQIYEHNGLVYLIIYFNYYNRFFKIDFQHLLTAKNLKKIDLDWCLKYAVEMLVYFPGRIEIL